MPSGFMNRRFCRLLWMYSSCSCLLLRASHGLSATKKNPAVGALHLGQKRKIGDGDDAFDARRLQQSIGNLLFGCIGALRRRTIGQLQGEEHVALIFSRDEASGKAAAEKDGGNRNQDEAPPWRSQDL